MIKKILVYILTVNMLLYSATLDNNTTNTIKEKEYKLIIENVKHLDKEDIAKALGVKDDSILLFWRDKNILKEEFVKNIKPTLKSYLENHGYFDAKFNVEKYNDIIKISINEGEPVRVTKITINSDFDIKNIINWKRGEIFKSKKFVDIKDKIINKLLKNGYCNYKLNTKAYIDLKAHSAKLKYNLKHNEVCYFGKVNIIKKPKDIKADVIYSRLKYKEGDRFDIDKIEDSYNSLNALNTFANLQIKYSLDDNNKTIDTDLSVNTREKLKRYMLAIGYDSELGTRVKGLWERRNFFSNAKKFTISTELSKNIQKIDASIFTPAFLNFNQYYFDLYYSGGYEVEKTDGYKQKKIYLDIHLDSTYKKWNFQTGLGLENLDIHLYEDLPYIIGGTFNLIYPYTRITYDGRDSKIDPRNGYYLSFYSEYGIANNKGGVQYIKYLAEARAIKSFGDLTLSAVGKIGSIHEVSGRLPASKLFYAGGLFTNRAYGAKEIGIVTSNKSYRKLGGKSFLNLQLEANYKLYKKLYGAIFFDSTLISEQEYKFHGNRIDTGGFGLRYKTPIGPVKIDIGFNIHNRKDHAISIMLGQSF